MAGGRGAGHNSSGGGAAVSHWPALSAPGPIDRRGAGRHGDGHANSRSLGDRQARMARNLYGPGVRMGNWNEDIYLEEVKLEGAGVSGRPQPPARPQAPGFGAPHVSFSPWHSPESPSTPTPSDHPRVSPEALLPPLVSLSLGS